MVSVVTSPLSNRSFIEPSFITFSANAFSIILTPETAIESLVSCVGYSLDDRCVLPSPTPTLTPSQCGWAASPQGRDFPSCANDDSRLSGGFELQAEMGDACCWQAEVNPLGFRFVQLTSANSGCGPTTIEYTVDQNNAIQRSNVIEITNDGGEIVATHRVWQPNHCTVTPTAKMQTPTPEPTP